MGQMRRTGLIGMVVVVVVGGFEELGVGGDVVSGLVEDIK
jgi:hypothetical protein